MKTIKRTTPKKVTPKRSIAGIKTKATVSAWLDSPEGQEWANGQLLSEHWQSDLKFFADEIRFLHTLISKYFMWLIEEDNIDKTRSISKELSELELKRQNLEQVIIQHQQHYRSLVENPFTQDSRVYKQEHAELESEIASFTARFKNLKRETFAVTEHILESEKVKHLLGS